MLSRLLHVRIMKILYLLHVNFGYSLETGYISKANFPHFIRLGHDCPNYPGTDPIPENPAGEQGEFYHEGREVPT